MSKIKLSSEKAMAYKTYMGLHDTVYKLWQIMYGDDFNEKTFLTDNLTDVKAVFSHWYNNGKEEKCYANLICSDFDVITNLCSLLVGKGLFYKTREDTNNVNYEMNPFWTPKRNDSGESLKFKKEVLQALDKLIYSVNDKALEDHK